MYNKHLIIMDHGHFIFWFLNQWFRCGWLLFWLLNLDFGFGLLAWHTIPYRTLEKRNFFLEGLKTKLALFSGISFEHAFMYYIYCLCSVFSWETVFFEKVIKLNGYSILAFQINVVMCHIERRMDEQNVDICSHFWSADKLWILLDLY